MPGAFAILLRVLGPELIGRTSLPLALVINEISLGLVSYALAASKSTKVNYDSNVTVTG